MKRVIPKVSYVLGLPTETYYVRDASGNIMATYKRYYYSEYEFSTVVEERIEVEEHHLYGSSRIGVTNSNTILAYRYGANLLGEYEPETPEYTIPATPAADAVTYLIVGHKNYELTNHLGNVLATITDRKVPNLVWNATANNYDITYFKAQATTITDYYPFGQQIEERSWVAASSKYRFGFNGQEKDNEVSGEGSSMTAEYWQYDSRLGRRWNVDPIFKEFESPYATFSNNPIFFIDPFGLDPNPAAQRRALHRAERKKEKWAKKNGVESEDVEIFWDENTEGWRFKTDPPDGMGILWSTKSYGINAVDWLVGLFHESDERASSGITKDIGITTGQIIAELHPAVRAYNVGSKMGVWGNGKSLWNEEQSTQSVLLSITPFGKVAKIGKVGKLGIIDDASNTVYRSVEEGIVIYTGITNKFARRAAEHLAQKGIKIVPLLQNLTRADARAVEQALIEIHGLGKNGGSLLNKINSISSSNSVYAEQLKRGYELLKSIGYK